MPYSQTLAALRGVGTGLSELAELEVARRDQASRNRLELARLEMQKTAIEQGGKLDILKVQRDIAKEAADETYRGETLGISKAHLTLSQEEATRREAERVENARQEEYKPFNILFEEVLDKNKATPEEKDTAIHREMQILGKYYFMPTNLKNMQQYQLTTARYVTQDAQEQEQKGEREGAAYQTRIGNEVNEMQKLMDRFKGHDPNDKNDPASRDIQEVIEQIRQYPGMDVVTLQDKEMVKTYDKDGNELGVSEQLVPRHVVIHRDFSAQKKVMGVEYHESYSNQYPWFKNLTPEQQHEIIEPTLIDPKTEQYNIGSAVMKYVPGAKEKMVPGLWEEQQRSGIAPSVAPSDTTKTGIAPASTIPDTTKTVPDWQVSRGVAPRTTTPIEELQLQDIRFKKNVAQFPGEIARLGTDIAKTGYASIESINRGIGTGINYGITGLKQPVDIYGTSNVGLQQTTPERRAELIAKYNRENPLNPIR